MVVLAQQRGERRGKLALRHAIAVRPFAERGRVGPEKRHPDVLGPIDRFAVILPVDESRAAVEALEAILDVLHLDGVLIEQVLYNLLENANRYTSAGSYIEIGARMVDNSVEIRIADNGPGLPTGSESRVFEKFFRGAVSSADGRRGVGLGLAICREIVHAHGGQIRARNRPEGGAEFLLVLPCEEAAPRVILDEPEPGKA